MLTVPLLLAIAPPLFVAVLPEIVVLIKERLPLRLKIAPARRLL